VLDLVAYFRGLPILDKWKGQLANPRTIKALIRHLHRPIWNPSTLPAGSGVVPIAWNGQFYFQSCLTDERLSKSDDWGNLPDDLSTLDRDGGLFPGKIDNGCPGSEPGSPTKRRRSGDDDGGDAANLARRQVCTPGSGGPGGGTPARVTYQPGSPSPTCASSSGCGGKLCTGYLATYPRFKEVSQAFPADTFRITDMSQVPGVEEIYYVPSDLGASPGVLNIYSLPYFVKFLVSVVFIAVIILAGLAVSLPFPGIVVNLERETGSLKSMSSYVN
jgi:hypothetical protein